MDSFVRYGRWAILGAFPILLTAAALAGDQQYAVTYPIVGTFVAAVLALPTVLQWLRSPKRSALPRPHLWATLALWIALALWLVAMAINPFPTNVPGSEPGELESAVGIWAGRIGITGVPPAWLAQMVTAFLRPPEPGASPSTRG